MSDHDGYIVTGSPKSNSEKSDWVERLHGFIRKLDEARAPTIGICFGHQAIAEALGGRLQPNPGDDERERFHGGVATLHVSAREPWMEPWRERLSLFAAHEEQVTRLPPSARLLGWSHDCPAAFLAVGDHMMACEFHPEGYRDFMRALVASKAEESGEDGTAEMMREIEGKTDAGLFGEWMARFLDRERGPLKAEYEQSSDSGRIAEAPPVRRRANRRA